MLGKIENKKLSQKKIYFVTTNTVGLSLIYVSFDNEENLYPNKRFKILTDTNVIINGSLKYDDSYYLLLDDVLVGGEYTSEGVFMETFEIDEFEEDSVLVGLGQIRSKLKSTEDIYDVNHLLIERGTPGLVDGNEKLKLTETRLKNYYQNPEISFLTPTYKLFGFVNINTLSTKKEDNFKHIFGIDGLSFKLECEINLKKNSNLSLNDANNYSLNVLNFSTSSVYKNISVELTIKRKTSLAQNLDYLLIYGRFNISNIVGNISGNSDLVNRVYHKVKHIDDVKFIEVIYPDLTSYDLTYDLGLLYQNQSSTTFVINNNTMGYDDMGIKLRQRPELLISDNTNLNNLRNPGVYYKHNGNISSITNKPITNNTRFIVEVKNYNNELVNNELFIVQRFLCYQQIGTTTNFQLTTFERVSTYVSSTFTWSPWFEISKKNHTHVPTDIIETTTKRFVSQQDVDNWNALLSSATVATVWKSPVTTPTQLYSTYPTPGIGWTVYVLSTGSLHIFNGSTWVNQKAYASAVNDGIITSQIFKDIVIGAGIDKKIDLKDSYIHRLTENPETIYGANYSMINDNHIDLVKRTTPLITQLKEYTIQNGWNVNAYGSNSVMYGKDINSNSNNNIGLGLGLEFSVENQIFLGKYNNSSNNVIFGIGNGNSNTERNNIFSVLNTGRTLAEGYSIPSGTQNDILLGNGDKLNKFDFIQAIYNDLSLAGTEIVVVPAGNETFEIVWNSVRKTNYGKFGTFEIWLKVGENVYNKESVPVRMITELNVENQLQAVSYTLTLSSLEAIVLIK